LGIKKINGRVITDDSYYNYQPIPAKWLWEDAGNYYGAGAYGLSVFDNTYEIHFKTSADSLTQIITGIYPEECRFEFANWLVAAGTANEGYVFAAPYSTNGWLAGKIPANLEDYVMEASIADPPLIMAKVIDQKLRSSGITISRTPSTTRLLQSAIINKVYPVDEVTSPPLKKIIEVLNHKSMNMYAEHLTKELGKVYKNNGSTESGVEVIKEFLAAADINTGGMFIEDGSGLSPLDALNAGSVANLLFYMKSKGHYFDDFYSSLPEAGKEGTLKNIFSDPVFEGRIKAKSGSMTRVRSYAGYLTTLSGKEFIFCIIVNNFSGPSGKIISNIEDILKETIQSN
jgi:D-alanyl-D-alanine carboxypeptidase/D-alanyl-D-alanine-endopeptidase (penicillin-binding protein 4)